MLLEDALLEENNLIEMDTLIQAKRLIEAKSMEFAELPGAQDSQDSLARVPNPRALRLKENEKGSLLSLAKASKN